MTNRFQALAVQLDDHRHSVGAKFRHEDLDLIRDEKGWPIWNMDNALRLLSHHGDWHAVLAFNEFTCQRVLLKPISGEVDGTYPRAIQDDDYAAVLAWFNRNGFPRAKKDIVQDAVRKTCAKRRFDPLKDFLEGLEWDGVARLDKWLSSYCGAEPNAYISETGKRWCISAVARGLRPGCKADHMLVLEGPQGRRKSTALATLAGSDWFSDSLPQMGSKDASSYLRGKWIVEVSELESMRKDVDQIKAFLSRQAEIYRPAYAREEVTEKRRCVFAGTTNKDDWQRDETGGRRFWPVKVGSIDIDGLKQVREQLWAEAVALYRAGERWWLEGEVAETAQAVVAERQADDPWLSEIEQHIRGRDTVTPKEILGQMGIVAADQTPSMSRRVAQQLRVIGWEKTGRVTNGENKGQYRYEPVKQSEER